MFNRRLQQVRAWVPGACRGGILLHTTQLMTSSLLPVLYAVPVRCMHLHSELQLPPVCPCDPSDVAAHITGFCLSRSYIYEVDQMGALTDKVQLVSIRAMVIQACQMPANSNTSFCALLPNYIKALDKEVNMVETGHQVSCKHGKALQATESRACQ